MVWANQLAALEQSRLTAAYIDYGEADFSLEGQDFVNAAIMWAKESGYSAVGQVLDFSLTKKYPPDMTAEEVIGKYKEESVKRVMPRE